MPSLGGGEGRLHEALRILQARVKQAVARGDGVRGLRLDGAEHEVLGIISGLWLVSFPLTLVVSVILTCFRKYQLFIYLMFADALWCGVTLLHALSIGSAGMSDFQLLCIGACVHVIIAIAIFRKFKQPEEAYAKE